jgi:hypothetical protein
MASIKGYFDNFSPNIVYRKETFFGNPEKIVNTTSGYTVTANTGVAAIDNLGSNPYQRSCVSFVGGGGATNGHNFAEVTASHKLNKAKPVRIMFGYYSEQMAVSAFTIGLGTVGTAIAQSQKSGGTYLANLIMLSKWTTTNYFRVQARKASGTAEEKTLSESLSSSVWYDYDILITPDADTAGKGLVQVARQANLGGYSLVTPVPVEIALALPDTFVTSLEFQYNTGDTGTTLKDAISHVIMEVGG